MVDHDKSLVKISTGLARFYPKERKELIVRGLNAITEIRNAEFYFFKGEEHRIRKELKMAISFYIKALQIDPKHRDSFFNMGYCQGDLGLYEDAIKSYKRAIEIDPDYSGAYYNIGIRQYEMADYNLALKNFEKYLEIEDCKLPENQECITYAKNRISELKKIKKKQSEISKCQST